MRETLLSTHKNLEKIYQYLVGAINEASEKETTRVNPVLDSQIKCCFTGDLIKTSPSEEGVLDFPQSDWVRIFAYDRSATDAFAIYLPWDGKIYLRKDEWCLSNFLHETLHSRSIFSKKDGPHRNLKFVYEGITELLTGWILKSKYNECFSEWSSIETCFLKTYGRWIKMWNYFSWRIGIQRLLEIYLDCSLVDPLKSIIELADKKGFQIQNTFSPYEPYADLESRFTNELSGVFGSDFDEYMSSDVMVLKPGNI